MSLKQGGFRMNAIPYEEPGSAQFGRDGRAALQQPESDMANRRLRSEIQLDRLRLEGPAIRQTRQTRKGGGPAVPAERCCAATPKQLCSCQRPSSIFFAAFAFGSDSSPSSPSAGLSRTVRRRGLKRRPLSSRPFPGFALFLHENPSFRGFPIPSFRLVPHWNQLAVSASFHHSHYSSLSGSFLDWKMLRRR